MNEIINKAIKSIREDIVELEKEGNQSGLEYAYKLIKELEGMRE